MDRALANAQWTERFLQSTVWNLPYTSSDHLPIFVKIKQWIPRNGQQQTRIVNAWFQDSESVEIVKRSWENHSREELIEGLKKVWRGL